MVKTRKTAGARGIPPPPPPSRKMAGGAGGGLEGGPPFCFCPVFSHSREGRLFSLVEFPFLWLYPRENGVFGGSSGIGALRAALVFAFPSGGAFRETPAVWVCPGGWFRRFGFGLGLLPPSPGLKPVGHGAERSRVCACAI